MQLKYRVNELIKERANYVDFLRCDAIITMDQTLGLCGEITRVGEAISNIQSKSLLEAEKEANDVTYEMPSSMNKDAELFEQIRKPWGRKKAKMPIIPKTWDRYL
jgi:hypothetical protein